MDYDWNITAQWSSSFLSIEVDFVSTANEIMIQYDEIYGDCSAIFDNRTMILLSSSAVCTWISNQYYSVSISIQLSSQSIININDSLIIKSNAFSFTEYICEWLSLNSSLIIDIKYPEDILLPNIMVNIPSMIGVCDELILDARNTGNIGGRSATFIWTILNISSSNNSTNNSRLIGMNYNGSYIPINDYIDSPSILIIQLMVQTWFVSLILFSKKHNDVSCSKV